MLAVTRSLCLQGIEATPVTVEVDIHNGLPAFDIVGLASQSVKEAKERVRAAIKNSGFEFPLQRITVNLAPADLRKEGSHFDLPIALGILLASRQVEGPVQEAFMAGEVSLDGSLRQVPGVLPMVLALCQTCPGAHLLIPPGNAAEAALVPGLNAWLAPSLAAAAAHLSGNRTLPAVTPAHAPPASAACAHPDLSDIRGQEGARRALEVAAAGGHNLLLIGPPGSGKTMLARRLPGLLPPMTREEVLDTSRIYSVAGLLHRHGSLVAERPFRAPHHTASSAAVIGGGRGAHPGEVSLAHHGVLFLDELAEFPRDVLEALRQPLEEGTVTVVRAQARATYPARFMLVAAMNPCPCGHFNDPVRECCCTPHQVQRYLGRISGPLLDRSDLQVEVARVTFEEMRTSSPAEASASVRTRVAAARERQAQRYRGLPFCLNAHLDARQVRQFCRLEPEAEELLGAAFSRLALNARGHDRILKVARTIADLEASELIQPAHLAEAIRYRSLDKKYWSRP